MPTTNDLLYRRRCPTKNELSEATTIRKLAARLNTLVKEFDARGDGRADLPLVVEVRQLPTPTGRLREDAYVPVRFASSTRMGIYDSDADRVDVTLLIDAIDNA
jgi:hypothetical protein